MKRFFGTTLATLSVYAAWSAWYAGYRCNPTTLAGSSVNEGTSNAGGGISTVPSPLSHCHDGRSSHPPDPGSDLGAARPGRTRPYFGGNKCDHDAGRVVELREAIQKRQSGSAPYSKCGLISSAPSLQMEIVALAGVVMTSDQAILKIRVAIYQLRVYGSGRRDGMLAEQAITMLEQVIEAIQKDELEHKTPHAA